MVIYRVINDLAFRLLHSFIFNSTTECSLPVKNKMLMKQTPKQRADFLYFLPIQTRWSDNDIYGHVNNVTYYSYFDTAANALLIEKPTLIFDIHPSLGWWWIPLVASFKSFLILKLLKSVWSFPD